MMTRTLTRVALLGGLSFAAPLLVLASGSYLEGATPVAEAPARAESPALVRALEAVQPDRISADLHFLAADDMGGRNTPSKELEVAAQFLRARLQRLEFQPGAGESYFFEYPLVSSALDPDASTASWSSADGDHELALASGYYISAPSISADSDVKGPLTSVGEGSKSELADLDLSGSWALLIDHEGRRTRSVARALQKIKKTGAIGVLIIPGAEYSGKPLAERFGGEAYDRLVKGRVRFPRPEGKRSARRSMPVVYLDRARGLELLAACTGHEDEADWFPAAGVETGVSFHEKRALKGDGGQVMVKDVCGFWPGSDPELSKEVILVSAHYDHVGTQDGVVYNGADDNGSGTSGVLAVAEALKAYGPLKRSVLLIWVSGEEKGLWGSKAWANNPQLPEGHRAVANLNIDMIGRNDPNQLFMTPSPAHKQFNIITETAMRLSPLEDFPELESADDYYHRSDQAEFARLDIPVAFLFAGIHEDYHQPSDTVDKIDFDKLSRVVRLVVRLLDELQETPLAK